MKKSQKIHLDRLVFRKIFVKWLLLNFKGVNGEGEKVSFHIRHTTGGCKKKKQENYISKKINTLAQLL